MTIIILHTNDTIFFKYMYKKRMWKVFAWKCRIGGLQSVKHFFLYSLLSLPHFYVHLVWIKCMLFRCISLLFTRVCICIYINVYIKASKHKHERLYKLSVKTVHWKWKRNTHYERKKQRREQSTQRINNGANKTWL